MSKKNKLPLKSLVWIMVILMFIAYRTNQESKYLAMHPEINISSQNFFSQIMGFLFGIHDLGSRSSLGPNGNNSSNQNGFGPNANANGQNKSNANSTSAAGTMSQGSNNQGENPAGNTRTNANDNSELNSENASSMNEENNQGNSGLYPLGNAEMNAENNPEYNPENNPENPGTNAENNPGENAETTQGNGPGGNTGTISGGNPGGGSDNNSGGFPGCGAGCSTSGNPGNINYTGLPTINPIPSNAQVMQSISQQNQEASAMAAILTTRQALVQPVQQAAQDSKFQKVDASSIPSPTSYQAPADIIEKLRNNQLQLH